MSTPLFENILAQPSAFETVGRYQLGPGREALARSAELLRESKRIVITGMGASLFAAIPLAYALGRVGMNASVIEAGELLHFLLPGIDRDTAVVLVSRSGESVELLKLLDALGARNCLTVAVVNVPESGLAQRARQRILMGSPPDQLVAVQTYLATVVTLALLGAACLNQFEDAESALWDAIPAFSSWVPACAAASNGWQEFVNLPSPPYILGRGPGLASVEEGVLLMHEVAKNPAAGMPVAQFRHGFVEAADERMRAVVIGAERETAELDRQFAMDLTAMGATVRWIGPLAQPSILTPLCAWPGNIPERFAPVFPVVPLQLLAYRMAEARGIVPGVFRWASTVTGSESGFPGLERR